MPDSPKRKRWAWWIVIAIALPVAYVLSYGPYNMLYDSGCFSQPVMDRLEQFYWPLGWTLLHGPRPASDALLWYVNFWVPNEALCK